MDVHQLHFRHLHLVANNYDVLQALPPIFWGAWVERSPIPPSIPDDIFIHSRPRQPLQNVQGFEI